MSERLREIDRGGSEPVKFKTGVTLLEILVSIALLALVAVPIFHGTGIISKSGVRNELRMVARGLLEQKMVEIEQGRLLKDGSESGAFSDPFQAYFFKTKIEPVQFMGTLLIGLHKVSLSVYWKDALGPDGIDIETYLVEPKFKGE